MEQNKTSCLNEDMQNIYDCDCIDWEMLVSSNILITGATGLIGSILTKTLLYKSSMNITVFAHIRNIQKAHKVFECYLSNPNLRFVEGDISCEFSISNRIDYIIHCASVTTSSYMVSNPVDTLKTSVMGTLNIMDFAQLHNVKGVLYVSSMEAYGITDPKKKQISESDLGYIDILNPRSSYSEGKRTCECICAAYNSQYNIPVKIARLAQTFGAGVPKDDTRVFSQFAKSVINSTDIILHTSGESVGNYCYTADVICGMLCILTRGKNKEAYTIVNEAATMKIKEMAEFVSTKIANGKIRVVVDIPENSASLGYAPTNTMRLSSDKLRTLGWHPKYDLHDMYKRLITDWQNQY